MAILFGDRQSVSAINVGQRKGADRIRTSVLCWSVAFNLLVLVMVVAKQASRGSICFRTHVHKDCNYDDPCKSNDHRVNIDNGSGAKHFVFGDKLIHHDT